MISEGDTVYIRCLVKATRTIGPTGLTDPLPDVADLAPLDCEGNIIKKYVDNYLCFHVDNVIGYK